MTCRPLRSRLLAACTVLLLLSAPTAQANNIQVSNATLTNNTGTTVLVQFDLSWENSWRGGGVNNWDAAWVFVKYRTNSNGAWQHMNLGFSGHVAAPGSQIANGLLTPGGAHNATTNPVLGVFIYRSSNGNGNLSLPATQLQWNYLAGGLAYNDVVEVQVFAIEMVHIPQGAFAAGSGGAEQYAFTLTTINTADASIDPSGAGSLGGEAGGYPNGSTLPVNGLIANWPNGFNKCYGMKYELSQQGYVDFLNTLTYDQQVARTANAPSSSAGTGALITGNSNRNGIDIQTPGVANSTPAVYACNLDGDGNYGEAGDGKEIACNYVSWWDFTAYLDWSGLRPMTELEFEKACRGPVVPVPNEYPWSSTTVAASAYTLGAPGTTTEGIATNYSTTVGNANYTSTEGTTDGPMRVGLFAANVGSTGRTTAGAGYYGQMELGGNLGEMVLVLFGTQGFNYTGNHGNGTLTVAGEQDVLAWPSASPATGTSWRGGSWAAAATTLRSSDRSELPNVSGGRTNFLGGRGIRNAP